MSAPTQQSKLVDAKIKYLERCAMALKQKRAVTGMKKIPRTQSINQTQNSDLVRYSTDLYNRQLREKADASAVKI